MTPALLALPLLLSLQPSLTVVPTGADARSVDAAHMIAGKLAAPAHPASLTLACVHDLACGERPRGALIVATAHDRGAAGFAVHMELVGADGITLAVEDVTSADWAMMPAILAPAVERLARHPLLSRRAPTAPPSTTPAEMTPYSAPASAEGDPGVSAIATAGQVVSAASGIAEVAGAIGAGCCVLGAVGCGTALALRGGDETIGPASEACGNIGNIPACICGGAGLGLELCAGLVNLLGTVLVCLDTLNTCASCQIPQAVLLAQAAQAAALSASPEPTEGGPPSSTGAMRY